MSRKQLLVPMSLALHTKFKHRAKQDRKSMSSIVRGLIEAYLNDEVEPGEGALPSMPKPPRPEPANADFYDSLASKVHASVEGS